MDPPKKSLDLETAGFITNLTCDKSTKLSTQRKPFLPNYKDGSKLPDKRIDYVLAYQTGTEHEEIELQVIPRKDEIKVTRKKSVVGKIFSNLTDNKIAKTVKSNTVGKIKGHVVNLIFAKFLLREGSKWWQIDLEDNQSKYGINH